MELRVQLHANETAWASEGQVSEVKNVSVVCETLLRILTTVVRLYLGRLVPRKRAQSVYTSDWARSAQQFA